MIQIATFSGTNMIAVQNACNAFVAGFDSRFIRDVKFSSFQRGALTQFTYTVIYFQ